MNIWGGDNRCFPSTNKKVVGWETPGLQFCFWPRSCVLLHFLVEFLCCFPGFCGIFAMGRGAEKQCLPTPSKIYFLGHPTTRATATYWYTTGYWYVLGISIRCARFRCLCCAFFHPDLLFVLFFGFFRCLWGPGRKTMPPPPISPTKKAFALLNPLI